MEWVRRARSGAPVAQRVKGSVGLWQPPKLIPPHAPRLAVPARHILADCGAHAGCERARVEDGCAARLRLRTSSLLLTSFPAFSFALTRATSPF